MPSLDATQQPSYHVKAADPSTAALAPLPETRHKYGSLKTGSFEVDSSHEAEGSHTSTMRWTQTSGGVSRPAVSNGILLETATAVSEESSERNGTWASRPIGVAQVYVQEAPADTAHLQASFASLSSPPHPHRWNTASAPQRSDIPTVGDELDESVSCPNSQGVEDEDGPSISTPPNANPELPDAALHPQPAPVITPAKKTPTSKKNTPLPISTFTPTRIRTARVSKTSPLSSHRKRIRLTPTRAGSGHVERAEESFGEEADPMPQRPKPRAVLDELLKARPGEMTGRGTEEEMEEIGPKEVIMDDHEGNDEDEVLDESLYLADGRRPDVPGATQRPVDTVSAGAEETSILVQQAEQALRPAPQEEQVENESPPTPVSDHPHHPFGSMQSSEPSPSLVSNLFTSSAQDFGEEESIPQYTFTATQSVNTADVLPPSSPAPDLPPRSSPPPSHSPIRSAGQTPLVKATAGAAVTAASASSTATAIPVHRRLGRVNPRIDIDDAPKPLGLTARLHDSLPGPFRKQTAKTTAPRTVAAPERIHHDMEPTQVDERPSSPLPVALIEGLPGDYLNTFVDDAPLSPPPEGHPSSPIRFVLPAPASSTHAALVVPSSPPTSPLPETKPNDAVSGANSADADIAEQTCTDESTLNFQPPSSPTTPRYRGKRTRHPTKKILDQINDKSYSEDSSPSPEDPDDYSFRPTDAKLAKVSSNLPILSNPKQKVTRRDKSTSIVGKLQEEVPQASDGESSSAPEDKEDYSYRPAVGAKRRLEKTRSNGRCTRASSTSTNSKHPVVKRIKLNAPKAGSTFNGSGASKAKSVVAKPHSPTPTTPLQILGYWGSLRSYFPGTVGERKGDRFHVDFADGTNKELPIDKMRLLELRKGDTVKATAHELQDSGAMDVAEMWDGITREVKVAIDGTVAGYIPLASLYIPEGTVKKHFGDRRVLPVHLGLDGADFPNDSASESLFAYKGFMITSNLRNSPAVHDLSDMIKRHGGRVMDDWQKLFERPNDGFGSTFKASDTAPFVIVHGGEGMKPKGVAALAAGIPCLASEFIADAVEKVG